MSVCADGQGICRLNKNNQPSSSSVSRDEGLVCFPPLNQSFTICWACWQLPSRAEGLRDTTFAPGYHGRASRITTSNKQSFKPVLKGASWESYMDMKGKIGQCRCLEAEMMDKPPERRNMTQDTPSAVRTGEHSTLYMLATGFEFSEKAINAKPWRTVEAHVKTWKKPSVPRILSSAGSVEQMGYLPCSASNTARGLSKSWTLKVMDDKVLMLFIQKDDAVS